MLHSEPKPVTAEARALLRVAEGDWKTVELLLQHPDAPVASLCFQPSNTWKK